MKNILFGSQKKTVDENSKEYQDDYGYYDEVSDNKGTYKTSEPEFNDDNKIPKEGVSFGAVTKNIPVSLKVVKPRVYDDAKTIADYLAEGSTVVLNIEELETTEAIRLIDFLMGAIHVLDGEMKSVTKTTLVLAPKNVGVSDVEDN